MLSMSVKCGLPLDFLWYEKFSTMNIIYEKIILNRNCTLFLELMLYSLHWGFIKYLKRVNSVCFVEYLILLLD